MNHQALGHKVQHTLSTNCPPLHRISCPRTFSVLKLRQQRICTRSSSSDEGRLFSTGSDGQRIYMGAQPAFSGDAGGDSSLQAALQQLQALEAFRAELSKAEDPGKGEVDLFYCAVLIARHAYPGLQHTEVSRMLDDIVLQVEAQLPPPDARYPLRVLRCINKVLYGDLGFKGNTDAYYDPDNSCINQVILRRTGIPITLSLVYMEVARRVGLAMLGASLPAHFMIMPAAEGVEVLVDPFNGGEVLYLQDASERISAMVGHDVHLDPKIVEEKRALPPRAFLMRMLTNLKQIYITAGHLEKAMHILRFMREADPSHLVDLRDLGVALYALQRYGEAAEVLQQYVVQAQPSGSEAVMVSQLMRQIEHLRRSAHHWRPTESGEGDVGGGSGGMGP